MFPLNVIAAAGPGPSLVGADIEDIDASAAMTVYTLEPAGEENITIGTAGSPITIGFWLPVGSDPALFEIRLNDPGVTGILVPDTANVWRTCGVQRRAGFNPNVTADWLFNGTVEIRRAGLNNIIASAPLTMHAQVL